MDKVYINPDTQSIEYEEGLNTIELEVAKEDIVKWDVWLIKTIVALVISIKDKVDNKRHKGLDKKKSKLETLKKQLHIQSSQK